ncbi:MAG: hypothetical protein AAGJ46_19455 [Planctomycetota bacterium]
MAKPTNVDFKMDRSTSRDCRTAQVAFDKLVFVRPAVLEVDSSEIASFKKSSIEPAVDEPTRAEFESLELCAAKAASIKHRSSPAVLARASSDEPGFGEITAEEQGIVHGRCRQSG